MVANRFLFGRFQVCNAGGKRNKLAEIAKERLPPTAVRGQEHPEGMVLLSVLNRQSDG